MTRSSTPRERPARRRALRMSPAVPWGLVLLGLVQVGLVVGPVATPHPAGAATTAARGTNRIGDLTVVRAFLPLPPSPLVASIYLTVKNSGAHPDALVSVTSTAALSAMLMTENPDGSMNFMRELKIPAHGQASLIPGQDHVMLEVPKSQLHLGERVPVTLRFVRAGSLTIRVLVVPLSRILEHP